MVAAGLVLAEGGVASATEGFESGACLVTVEATVSGDTLLIDTLEDGTCVTNGGMGFGEFDASIPGLVGFHCGTGYVVGAGNNGTGLFTVMVGGDIFLSATNMLVVGESDGAVLTVAFETKVAARVIAGHGTFALIPDSDPPCSAASPVTTWTGVIEFVDPEVPE